MAIRTYKVTLDSKNTIAPEPVYLRQGDKTGAVVIDATLMDNGSAVSLSGLTPMFKANTADGQAVIADSTGFTVTDSVNGKFTYQVPNALSAVPGKITTAYFSLSDADGSESTFDVAFIIKAAIDISQGQAEDYITIIDGTLNSLQEKIDDMNTDIKTVLNAYNQGDFYNKSETDSKDASTLTFAKIYADSGDSVALTSAKSYTDSSLSGIVALPETFANLAAIKAKYPAGKNGLMVAADNGHKYIWANSTWTDAGIYQAVGIAESDRTDYFGTLYSTLGDINKKVTGSLGKEIQFSGVDKAASTDSVNYKIDNYGVTTLAFNRTGNWVFLQSQLGDYSKIEGKHLTVILENTGTYTPQDFNILLSNTGDWAGSSKIIGTVVFENGVFKVEFDVTSDNLGFTPEGNVYLLVRNLGANDVSKDVSVRISASFIASSTYGSPDAFSLKALESAHSVQSDNSAKSDFAKSAKSAENVGIKPLINSISSSNPYVTCTQLNATDFKVSKDYSKDSQSFPKIFLEVDYDSIDDLDENFILKITDNNQTSSEGIKATANVFYILSEKADWNSLWHPINFSEGKYNLKSLISNSDYSDYYNSAKKLYIFVGFYYNELNDSTIYGNMFFDINITARIENSAAVSVATELSSSLQEKINSESQYVNEIVCWGDSLTAMGGWTDKLATLTGMDVQNGGTGGETVRTIVARQGADIMTVNNITIPADITTKVQVGDYANKIKTQFGYNASPLLQGGSEHVNPVKIGDIEGTLIWTGNDTTGVWQFHRNTAGNAVTIARDTAMRTYFDREHNNPYLMIIFMGQNGGYSDDNDLVRMHKLMIEHSHAKNVLILGMHTGSASSRADYESAMLAEFGRKFFSLRQYLTHPIYDTDGTTIKSCWGLDDAGLTPTSDDLAKIAVGQVPLQLLLDGTHFTTTTRTVVGNAIYNYLKGLNIF